MLAEQIIKSLKKLEKASLKITSPEDLSKISIALYCFYWKLDSHEKKVKTPEKKLLEYIQFDGLTIINCDGIPYGIPKEQPNFEKVNNLLALGKITEALSLVDIKEETKAILCKLLQIEELD